MKIHYSLPEGTTLLYTLAIAQEVYTEMGLTPFYIETDSGEQVEFSATDFRLLEKGEITDDYYIAKHRIIQ